LERLPSGKFATNALVMICSGLAYNILRALVVGLTFSGSDKGQNYPTQEPKNCDHKQQNRHGHGKRGKQHTGFDRLSVLEYYDDEQSCSHGYGHPFQFLHG
jgi:hypothetical protein